MGWTAGGFFPLAQKSLPRTQRALKAKLASLAVLWLVGGVVLALLTWGCFRLSFSPATTSLVFMVAIVALSITDSILSSVVFSVAAVGCLDYFFIPPVYAFDVSDPQDVATLLAFLATSLAVTILVRRQRHLGDVQKEQARLLDLTHDPVMVRDMDHTIRFWNRGAESLYGWTGTEAVGQTANRLLQTEYAIPLERAMDTLLAAGRWEGEVMRRCKDGTPVIVACRWTLERGEDGHPLGILETNNDITDRKRAEEALRRTQETYLAEAQQLSRTGSFGWNVASGEIFWSEESFKIFGYEAGTVPSMAMFIQRVHPDDIGIFRQAIDGAMAGAPHLDFEHRLLMPDGSVKHLHVVAHAATDESGSPQLMGALMDVTLRKEAEWALRESEQRYRSLFHYMPIALWQLDMRGFTAMSRALRAEGVVDLAAYWDQHPEAFAQAMDTLAVEEVNQRAVEMLGARDASELVGPASRLWPQRPDTFRRALEAQFRGELAFQEETKIAGLGGRAIDVLFSAAWPGAIGQLDIGLIGLLDITERLRAQERLQQVQAEFAHAARISVLGELAASIAHEVNQPLGAITTNAETGLRWLNRPEPNAPKALLLLQRIVDDAHRAADIIARIRSMAAGRTPQQATLQLPEVIEQSLVFLRYDLQAKGVAISLDAAPGLPPIVGDRTQLQQVIVNLVINAAQAMASSPAGRRQLRIRTVPAEAGTLRSTFEDSGPGIGPDDFGQLFESFFTTKDVGMGMGLAISRSIVEAHGGRIRADNESTLGGARFTVELPVGDAASPGEPDVGVKG
jgi:PAS domain S-box-containing protein